MINHILIAVQRPCGEEKSSLGIRMAWASHAGGHDTSLLFLDDGVYNLLPQPGYNASLLKRYMEADGEVFCLRESLAGCGLTEKDLIDGVTLVGEADVADMAADADATTMF